MENKKRAVAKTLSYRVIVTILLAVISWIFTGDLSQTSGITIAFAIVATGVYYVHERIWAKVKWVQGESIDIREIFSKV
jgi:uncharacterized membrane protein